MPRGQQQKRHSEDAASESDTDNSEEDKVAVRRARNREAARRVRERRINAIKTLSEQVEQLVAENQELRDKLAAAESNTVPATKDPSPSASATDAGDAQNDQTQDGSSKAVSARSIAVQTEPEPAKEPPAAPVAEAAPAEQAQQQLWNPLLQQLQQQQQQLQQAASSSQSLGFLNPGQQLPAAAALSQNSAIPLFNLQQMQLLVQMQLQLLQVHSAATSASASSMQIPSIITAQPVQQESASQPAAAAGGSSYASPAAVPSVGAADAWSLAQQPQIQQKQQQQSPQLSNWGHMPSPSAAAALQSTGSTQRQPPATQQLLSSSPGQHRPQQQSPAPQMQQSTMQQQQQLAGKSPAAAPAGSEAAAAAVGTEDSRFRTIPEDNVLCQLEEGDDPMLFSADMNLSTGVLNINTGDLNMSTAEFALSNTGFSSGLNAMLASEELLRHVPTPEEATASRSTAWL